MLTRENKLDLFTTAVEGGSHYWCALGCPDGLTVQQLSAMSAEGLFDSIMDDGVSYSVYNFEDTEDLLGIIDKESIDKATKLIMDNHREHYILIIDKEQGERTADVWLQLVVMGKLIFG